MKSLLKISLLACLLLPIWSQAAELQGVIFHQGQPLGNSMVTLTHSSLNKSTTVYSDADGKYQVKVSDPGFYQLRIRRIGYNTLLESGLQLQVDTVLQRDASLEAIPKSLWIHELPASDWFARAEFSSSALKGQFSIQCAMCHQQGSSTTRLTRSTEQWQQLFQEMAEYGAVMDQQLFDEAPAVLNAAFDWQQADLSNFPDNPSVIDVNATGVVITEWQLGHPTAFLHDMVIGPQGKIYTVDWIGDKLYRLDPETNQVDEWAIPADGLEEGGILGILAERGRRYLHHTPTLAPHSLQIGPQGNVWITLSIGRGLTRFDPGTEQFTHFDHADRAKYPHTLRFDDDGNVWYTLSMTNHLNKLDTVTGEVTIYDLPTRTWTQWLVARSMGLMVWMANVFEMKGVSVVSDPEMNPVPYGIDITPDGKVWFSQFNNRRIGYIDPSQSDRIEMIDTPFYGPRRLRSDSKGILWIPSYNEGRFYRFDPASREFKEYNLPTGKGDMAYALSIDPRDDSVWLCGTNSDSIIHFKPTSEQFTTYQLPSRVSFTREIEVDERGNVWTSTSNMPYYQMERGQGALIRLSFPLSDEALNTAAK
jgi:streptogramin lyase